MTANLMAATSSTPQTLAVTQVSSANTETDAYTVPSASSLKIGTASLCNTTTGMITVSLSIVPEGGTAGTANRVLYQYPLAAGDTLSLNSYLAGALMGAGDFVSLNCSATGVTLSMTGAVGS